MEAQQFITQYNDGRRTFREIDLREQKIHFDEFKGVNLTHSFMDVIDFLGTKFIKSKLKCIKGRFSCFSFGRFEECDLEESDFSNADLCHTNFKNSNLKGCNFRYSNCRGADFSGSNLENVNFWGANLENAIFMDCRLPKGMKKIIFLIRVRFTFNKGE